MGPGKCPRSIRCVIAECYVPHFTYVCNLLFLLDSPWRRRRCTKITIKIGLKIGDRLLEEWITFTHESRVFISIITWCATEEGGKREAVGSIVGCWVGGQWWAKPMEANVEANVISRDCWWKTKKKTKRKGETIWRRDCSDSLLYWLTHKIVGQCSGDVIQSIG